MIKNMLREVPEDYDLLHKEYSLQGGTTSHLSFTWLVNDHTL